MSTPRKLSRSSNTAPELGAGLGTRVVHARYHEGQKVRYKNVAERYSTENNSIGTIRTVLRDVTPPVGQEEVRYEIENERTHTKTAIYERDILDQSN